MLTPRYPEWKLDSIPGPCHRQSRNLPRASVRARFGSFAGPAKYDEYYDFRRGRRVARRRYFLPFEFQAKD